MNADLNAGVALNPVEHLESTPAASAFDKVSGIGDLLNFSEHKPRHNNQTFEKVGLN